MGILGIVAAMKPVNGTTVVVSGGDRLMGRAARVMNRTAFHSPLRSAMESRASSGPCWGTMGILGIVAAMKPVNGLSVVASGSGILISRSSCTS